MKCAWRTWLPATFGSDAAYLVASSLCFSFSTTILSHKVVLPIHIADSSTVTDEVANYFEHRIFSKITYYSRTYSSLECDEKFQLRRSFNYDFIHRLVDGGLLFSQTTLYIDEQYRLLLRERLAWLPVYSSRFRRMISLSLGVFVGARATVRNNNARKCPRDISGGGGSRRRDVINHVTDVCRHTMASSRRVASMQLDEL